MDHDFTPAPHRCSDLVCRRSAVCRRPFAISCLTSPSNREVQRRRINEKLRQFIRDQGRDPDGPPPPDALPIEETLKMIREEAERRRAQAARTAAARRKRG